MHFLVLIMLFSSYQISDEDFFLKKIISNQSIKNWSKTTNNNHNYNNHFKKKKKKKSI